jgi:cell division protein FtsZ
MLRRKLLKILGCTPLISSLPSHNLLASVDPLTRSSASSDWGINAVNLELHYLSPKTSKDLPGNEPVIKVIGVGGGGGNAVQHMIENGIEGVEYMYLDTDRQKLKDMNASASIKVGRGIIQGLSTKTDSNIIKQVAMNGRKHIQESIEGSHILFIVGGMGGNAGSGLAQAIAQIAYEMDILTIAIVTKPIGTGSDEHIEMAEHAIGEIALHVDSLIGIPLDILTPTPEIQANGISYVAIKSIAELITRPNLVGIDFSDIRTVMSKMGQAATGSGKATGENRAKEATFSAISSPLLKDIKFEEARGMIVNITVGTDFSIGELDAVASIILQIMPDDASVVIGMEYADDPRIISPDELRVALVVTGLDKEAGKTVTSDGITIDFPDEKESMEYWDLPEVLRR